MRASTSVWLRWCVLACAIVLGDGILVPREGAGASQGAGEGGVLAVIFHRREGKRVYIGTAPAALANKLPIEATTAPPARRIPPPYDYEIWLAQNGTTVSLWYSSAGKQAGVLRDGEALAGWKDEGELQTLIESAQLPQPSPQRDKAMLSRGASHAAPPSSLEQLVARADVIIVGRVAGILRNAHTPFQHRGYNQHTVYVVAVEQYLKSGTGYSPAIVKVWQEGGYLPWVEADGETGGTGFINPEDPLLHVNDRYCLFLRTPEDPGGHDRRRGYRIASHGGVTGKVAELDEYVAAHHWRGKLRLVNGITKAPETRAGLEAHWRFERGPQVLDLPEDQALQTIRETVTRLRETETSP